MLINATEEHYHKISAFCKNHILGTRIMCLIDCYKFSFDFFNVMLSFNEQKELNCIISSFDSNITVHANADFDEDEVLQYLNMISFKSVTAEKIVAEKLRFKVFDEKTAYRFMSDYSDFTATNAQESDYKKIYRLISEAITGSFSDDKHAYLSWLSDFTFRKNRNKARMKCIKENDNIISCAMTSSESTDSAIISGVACDAEKRKHGSGKAVVLNLANELKKENKNIFVIALNDSAKGFYEHIGFEKECIITITER